MYIDLNVLKAVFLVILLIALTVLAVFLVVMVRKFIVTLENANEVLGNVNTVTALAAKRSEEIDGMVDNVVSAVSEMTEAVKSRKGIISSAANLIKSIAVFSGKVSGMRKDGKEKGQDVA